MYLNFLPRYYYKSGFIFLARINLINLYVDKQVFSKKIRDILIYENALLEIPECVKI